MIGKPTYEKLEMRLKDLEQRESDRKRTKDALEKRILALTMPLDDPGEINFEDLFNLEDIQRLQDEFASATGVASLITQPDGTPITNPSNFCRLCSELIRKSEKGVPNCRKSDSMIGRLSTEGLVIQPCLSAGLWDACAMISVGGKHIANWLIGQVRDETQTEDRLRAYAREIEVDEEAAVEAFREVPTMSRDQFERIARMLLTLANQLSATAYQNVQQARFITEIKNAENALKENEAQLRTLIHTIPDLVWLKGRQGNFLFCNSRFGSWFGAKEEDIIGKSDYDFFDKPKADLIRKDDKSVMTEGNAHIIEEEVVFKGDGHREILETIKTPMYGSDGQPTGVLGIGRDITERKQMEKALKENEQRLDLALSGADEGIWDWSINEDTLYFDSRYYTMAGYRPNEFPATFGEFEKRVHKEDIERVLSIISQYLAGDRATFKVEFRFLRKNGSYMWIQGKGKIVARDDKGTPERFIGTHADITERKQAEAELASYRNNLEELVKERTVALATAKEQAEAANRSKSEFLTNMSHELRTPLNAIMGFSQLMSRDATLSDNQKENLNLIHRSGKHLLALINDVLDMSKIEAGQAELHVQEFDLHSCIHGLAEGVQSRAVSRGLEFRLYVDPAVPSHVNGDEGKLRQILINLLGNALKFTIRGHISLEVKADPRPATDENFVHFIVSDTGEGIPEELQEAIFQPFVQVKRATDNLGTGLGLSISRRFAHLMGGNITVSSRPEQETRFTLSIPLRTAATIPVKPRTLQRVVGIAGDPRGYRILVVEDNADNRLLLTNLLETVGFEVRHAVNGREGVDLFSEWRPDLVFMDVRMPVMDGLSATKQIKSLDTGKDTPVIALTAHAFEDERNSIIVAGFDDFISKPVDENLLFDAMGRHLQISFVYQPDEEVGIESQALKGNLKEEADPMANIPGSLRSELREAALDLNTIRINDCIQQVKLIDGAASIMLRKLVDDFRFDKILELLADDA